MSGSLYTTLVTPEIVMGVSLLAFFQWGFRFLNVQLGMHTVILAHVMFSVAYVVIVIMARLRTLEPALEEAALDLGGNEWDAFRLVTLPQLGTRDCIGGATCVYHFVRRLRDHKHGGGCRLGDAADGDLCDGSQGRESGCECHIYDDRCGSGRVNYCFGTASRVMTRRTLFLMGIAGANGCVRDRRPRLNVFNWSSYVGPDTIPNFEREFNVQVRYAVYESNEEMLARVMGGNSGWDVVFPTNYLIEPMRSFGLLAPLDHSRLPNLKHLDAVFQKPGVGS